MRGGRRAVCERSPRKRRRSPSAQRTEPIDSGLTRRTPDTTDESDGLSWFAIKAWLEVRSAGADVSRDE